MVIIIIIILTIIIIIMIIKKNNNNNNNNNDDNNNNNNDNNKNNSFCRFYNYTKRALKQISKGISPNQLQHWQSTTVRTIKVQKCRQIFFKSPLSTADRQPSCPWCSSCSLDSCWRTTGACDCTACHSGRIQRWTYSMAECGRPLGSWLSRPGRPWTDTGRSCGRRIRRRRGSSLWKSSESLGSWRSRRRNWPSNRPEWACWWPRSRSARYCSWWCSARESCRWSEGQRERPREARPVGKDRPRPQASAWCSCIQLVASACSSSWRPWRQNSMSLAISWSLSERRFQRRELWRRRRPCLTFVILSRHVAERNFQGTFSFPVCHLRFGRHVVGGHRGAHQGYWRLYYVRQGLPISADSWACWPWSCYWSLLVVSCSFCCELMFPESQDHTRLSFAGSWGDRPCRPQLPCPLPP